MDFINKCLTNVILLWETRTSFKSDYLLGELSVKLWGFENYRIYRSFGETDNLAINE